MSGQVDDYFIVTNPNVKIVEAEVKKMIGQGWILYGELCGTSGGAPNAIPIFCQAMVKKKQGMTETPQSINPLKHKHSLYKNLT